MLRPGQPADAGQDRRALALDQQQLLPGRLHQRHRHHSDHQHALQPDRSVGRYWRGTGSDPTYWSMVVPLDYQQGVALSNLFGNCSNLYPGLAGWSGQTLYHYDATNALAADQLHQSDRL